MSLSICLTRRGLHVLNSQQQVSWFRLLCKSKIKVKQVKQVLICKQARRIILFRIASCCNTYVSDIYMCNTYNSTILKHMCYCSETYVLQQEAYMYLIVRSKWIAFQCGWLRLVGFPQNYRSLLQKRPIKEATFCKKDLSSKTSFIV